jgi:hypothetical protein
VKPKDQWSISGRTKAFLSSQGFLTRTEVHLAFFTMEKERIFSPGVKRLVLKAIHSI